MPSSTRHATFWETLSRLSGEAGDYRHATDHLGTKANNPAEVFVAHLGIDARDLHALFPIGNLEVDKEEIAASNKLLCIRKGNGKRGLDCRAHATLLTALEKLLGKPLAREALPARERHPTAGLLIKD
jgi:hypothetical protein